jgi:hypothetical protein
VLLAVNEHLPVVPLALIMVMGPQIVTAIFLVTSHKPIKDSLAMLLGVFIAASLGLLIWFSVSNALGINPDKSHSGPGTADWVVAGVLVLLAIHVVRTRGSAEAPKWMSALVEAGPQRAFALGFLLILLMPTDIVATIATAGFLHKEGLGVIDGWPLVVTTLLLMALPLLGYLLLGERAKRAMPGVRDWLTGNGWIVNLIVIAYFIYQLLR